MYFLSKATEKNTKVYLLFEEHVLKTLSLLFTLPVGNLIPVLGKKKGGLMQILKFLR